MNGWDGWDLDHEPDWERYDRLEGECWHGKGVREWSEVELEPI